MKKEINYIELYCDMPEFSGWGPGDWKILKTYAQDRLTLPQIKMLLDPSSHFYGQAIRTPDRGQTIFSALINYRNSLLQAAQHTGQLIRGMSAEDAKDIIEQLHSALYGDNQV